MKIQFDILIKSRELVLKQIDGLSIAQLHEIPQGFKNNIAWNVAHLVVTQQLLIYKMSDVNCLITDDLIKDFKKGTLPSKTFTEEEFDELKELFIALPDTLIEDYQAGIFERYEEYPTSTGVVLDSVDTAIIFNNFHEAMHLGIIMSLKKLV